MDRRRFLEGLGLAVAGAALAPACTSPASPPSTTRSDAVEPPPTTPNALDEGTFPSKEEIQGWIEQIVDRGIRRPGYPADTWTEEFVADQLREAGLEVVRLEPVEVTRWEPTAAELTVISPDGTRTAVACFPVPYARPVRDLSVELRAFDPDGSDDVAGRAALVDARVVRMAPDALVGTGSAPADRSHRVYDPDDTFSGAEQVLPHTAARRRILDPAIDAGAAAFIGTLTDYPGGGCEYYVPYDGVARPIPGVWISGQDGARLRERLAQGPVQIVLTVEATSTPATSHNVIGELPGADDELVVVGSHHDGPWGSAVEDASGTALVLAQARYWSSLPRARRPHRMVFLVNAGHMCGSAGLDAYLTDHAADLARTVLEVHLEHAALETTQDGDAPVATGECTPRWFFTSRLEPLESAVYDALVAEDLRRSMILAPDALGTNPPTDGGRFHEHGVPLVQFLAAPWYLFDPADTIDKIDTENLVPLTRAAARIITSTSGVSAAAMRSAGS